MRVVIETGKPIAQLAREWGPLDGSERAELARLRRVKEAMGR